jgi:hypothetical protein
MDQVTICTSPVHGYLNGELQRDELIKYACQVRGHDALPPELVRLFVAQPRSPLYLNVDLGSSK